MKKTIELTLFIEMKEDSKKSFRFEDTEGDIKEVSTAIQEEIKSNLESCKSSISNILCCWDFNMEV